MSDSLLSLDDGKNEAEPLLKHGAGTRRLVMIFLIAVPGFFALLALGLCLIVTEDWIEGGAVVQPAESIRHYAPQDAFVKSIHIKEHDAVKPGDVLLTLDSPSLRNRVQQLAQRVKQLEHEIARQALEVKKVTMNPVSADMVASKSALAYWTQEVAVLKERLSKFEKSLKRGSVSEKSVDDLRLSLARSKSQLEKAKHQHAMQQSGWAALVVDVEKNKLAGLKLDLGQAKENLALAEADLAALTVKAQAPGHVAAVADIHDGQFVPRGFQVAKVAKDDALQLKINVSERDIRHLRVGANVRFESATYSKFEYFNSYYIGTISEIAASTESADYLVRATIAKDPSAIKALPNLPYGSTGSAMMSRGKRNLLFQLIGWE